MTHFPFYSIVKFSEAFEATQNICYQTPNGEMNAHFLMYILVGKDDVDNDDKQQQFQIRSDTQRPKPSHSSMRKVVCFDSLLESSIERDKNAKEWNETESKSEEKSGYQKKVAYNCSNAAAVVNNPFEMLTSTKMNLFLPLNFVFVISLSP